MKNFYTIQTEETRMENKYKVLITDDNRNFLLFVKRSIGSR